MRRPVTVALFVAFLPIAYAARPVREAKSDPLPSQNTSTLDDQTDLALTVYNAVSGGRSLSAGIYWWGAGMLIAVGYFVLVYTLFRGKVGADSGH